MDLHKLLCVHGCDSSIFCVNMIHMVLSLSSAKVGYCSLRINITENMSIDFYKTDLVLVWVVIDKVKAGVEIR